jgi:3-isopropylmalate dehydratase small subunit
MISGKAIVLGNNIDTDQIIAASRLTLPSLQHMAPYAFEHHRDFTEFFTPGDIIVGGENFGCGSSREQAPAVLKELKVGAIAAKSFARIFYRNAINIGIPLLECKMTEQIHPGDVLVYGDGQLVNQTQNNQYAVMPYPPFIQDIFDHGGIVSLLLNS